MTASNLFVAASLPPLAPITTSSSAAAPPLAAAPAGAAPLMMSHEKGYALMSKAGWYMRMFMEPELSTKSSTFGR